MGKMKNSQLRLCVVGSGTRFLSGISYYTNQLANVLAHSNYVSVILMRQLMPTRFYPGHHRVGAALSRQKFGPRVKVYDGVDWYWIPSILRAIAFLIRERPDVIIFQWWTGTVLHSYLLLAWIARFLRARIIIEFHEVLDTAEARQRMVLAYVRWVMPWLIRVSSGFVIHSEFDRAALKKHYLLGDHPVAIIPHGPYDQFNLSDSQVSYRKAPEDCCNLLYFGVIRPFKGLEDLVAAFNAIPLDEINQYWLTIVGETWEGWTLPAELISRSDYKERITFINRYVSDEETATFFAGADAVVLPYHRSSTSGPLHIAMSQGLPVIITKVGGLIEAVDGYEGAFLVPPKDSEALRDELRRVTTLRGRRFNNPRSWEQTSLCYRSLLDSISS
jgi:glycosyltransferase involved in cell wall biosynthesis